MGPTRLSDGGLLFVGVAVVAAAFAPVEMGALTGWARLATLAAVVLAWRLRSAVGVGCALVVLTSLQAGAAWADAAAPTPQREFAGEVVLGSDVEAVGGSVRVRAEIDGRTHELRAWGSAAGLLRPRLMGERLTLDARLRPLEDPPQWLLASGLRGRGTVTEVRGFREGRLHTRIANSLRRTIESGARSLGRDDRALFTGLVYGDDRAQSPLTADDFDAAGLTHLLAVSGQNVAFVLALGGPLLRRMSHRGRYVAVGLLLLVFATMTRFEPSVVRASVMAGIASTGALVGTSVPSRRVLLLAVIGLVVWRPTLVHSVAFQLSVAASAGILMWSGRLARAIPGPRPLVEAIAVTSTAQLAVAPLLLWRFGGVPVAALPANVLAGPAAGPVMMWGMTGGWVAGLVPAQLAELLHAPTRLGVWWIAEVARRSATLGLGSLAVGHVVVIAIAGWFGLRQHRAVLRSSATLLVVAALAAPWVALQLRPPASGPLSDGTVLIRDAGQTVVVIDSPRPQRLLADLREADVRDIDLLVTTTASFAVAELIGFLETRHAIDTIWAPVATMGRGEVVPPDGATWALATHPIVVRAAGDRLDVGWDPPPLGVDW